MKRLQIRRALLCAPPSPGAGRTIPLREARKALFDRYL
jgi:hypothetical protein